MRKFIRNILIIFAAFVVLAGIFALLGSDKAKSQTIDFTTLAHQIQSGQVQKIIVNGNSLAITTKDNQAETSTKEDSVSLLSSLKDAGVTTEQLQAVNIDIQNKSGVGSWFSSLLPFLIPFVLISLFVYFLMRQVQGSNNRALSFGQSQARMSEETPRQKVTFDDVAGAREAKEELKEVVDFLKSPHKFLSLGARIPKGVLLLGSPGVGKTLMARAVAGEADVPFFHISGSEFVEMFVGVGASRVRDLFKKAKKNSPSIIFIDEIDAVGRQRGAGLGGSHDEREQTLNQILVEMDGFEQDSSVIVMAATNRADVLDPALLRPGRFDRQVVIDLPDLNERLEILKVHAKNKPLVAGIDLKDIAVRTPGFSGADLANLLNEAAILTVRREKTEIGMPELRDSIEKVMLGPERRSHVLSPEEKELAAYHEAGHAIVAAILPHAHYVHKISIISRGRAAGYVMKLPIEEKNITSKSELLDDLAVAMGGYASEQVIFNEIHTGASSDLQQATKIARSLAMLYGMSDEIGPVAFGEHHELVFLGKEIGEQKNYSEEVAAKIDHAITRFVNDALSRAKEIVTKHKEKLTQIKDVLMKQETIERDQFEELMGDLIPERKRKIKDKEAGVDIAPDPVPVV